MNIKTILGYILILLILPIIMILFQTIIQRPINVWNMEVLFNNIYLQASIAGFILDLLILFLIGIGLLLDYLFN